MRGNGRSIGGALVAVAIVMASWAASAVAAPTWLPPKDISGPNAAITFPEIAVNARGDAVAIWPRIIDDLTVIEAAERPAGGGWSKPDLLSELGEEDAPFNNAQVELDAAGNAVAIWSAGGVVRTALRPAGGDWSAADDLSAGAAFGSTPHLAIGAGGDAIAVWSAFDGTVEGIWAALKPAGGGWSEPEVISDIGEETAWFPRVAVDAAGDAIAVWRRIVSGEDPIRTARLVAGGEWSEPEDLSAAGEDGHTPRIALNPAGRAVAVWADFEGGEISVIAAVRPPGGGWSQPDPVSAADESAGEPELAIDATGNAVAAWSIAAGGGKQIVRAASLPAGGGWSEPDSVSAAVEDLTFFDLEASSAAGGLAAWTHHDGTHYRVQAARRPPGGEWSSPANLSSKDEDSGLPDFGFDAVGNAVAIWGRAVEEHYVVQGSGFDFTGPLLDGLSIPATGTVGVPVAFSVSPFDLFSPGPTSWSFGDASQPAAGPAVSHTYWAPGNYPVTVNAFDGSANLSTRTATIAIAPAPRPPFAFSLRVGKKSLRKLVRSGTLAVTASVSEAASVALSGRTKLAIRTKGGVKRTLVPIFTKQTVRFAAAGEQRVTLVLNDRGRAALSQRSQARLLIAANAQADGGGLAQQTVAQTLR